MDSPLDVLRSFRADNQPIRRGMIPHVGLRYGKVGHPVWWWGLAVSGIISLIISSVIHYCLPSASNKVVNYTAVLGFYIGIIFFYYQPIIAYCHFIIRCRRRPFIDFFDQFHTYQKRISVFTLTFFLLLVFNAVYPTIVYGWDTAVSKAETHRNNGAHLHEGPINNPMIFLITWTASSMLFGFLMNTVLTTRRKPLGVSASLRYPATSNYHPSLPFNLWLGQSTGKLATLFHKSAIAPQHNITLSLTDAAQNVLVLGGIGSGKTTRAIHPLLVQLLDQDCGGLIFDIKGDFKHSVEQIAGLTHKSFTTIGVHQTPMNLLAGLPPEMAASFLKSAFMLSGGSRQDSFWVDTATELCRNSLGALSFLPEHYSLHGLYNYLFDNEFRKARDSELMAIGATLSPNDMRLLGTYMQYYERIYHTFDEKLKGNINATVAQVLAPFNHPDLIDAFCTAGYSNSRMEAILDGSVLLVDMPLSRWGLGGKVVYSFIKLRFFNMMQQRTTRPDWDQERAVFFMCDEYQEIVSCSKDGLSDLNFWDKSRSSKTIGVVSAQSVSSFYAAIGDRDIANALLQNFRQKLCFKTEDQATIDLLNRLLGKVEFVRVKESVTQGSSRGSSGSSSNSSVSHSMDYTEKSVLDAQTMRGLLENQAVALLSVHGSSMDDVLNMQPVFI